MLGGVVSTVGPIDGGADGALVGTEVGTSDGLEEGSWEGSLEGFDNSLGKADGFSVGCPEGLSVIPDGEKEGDSVGCVDNTLVGCAV